MRSLLILVVGVLFPMAEFCRKCFIRVFRPSASELSRVVMSEDETLCEGCMVVGPYVDYIAPEGGAGSVGSSSDVSLSEAFSSLSF